MPQYLLCIAGDPADAPQPGSEFEARQREKWAEVTQQLQESGAFVAGARLQGTETATTVRERAGEVLVTDGPFVETKEVLAGYYLIDVEDLDAAIAWARRMPNVTYGSIEVRPLFPAPTG
ncbi:YciI family protein [Conexibacter sp. SYSU D00693]|uniref:YciI family protein n=1 Tax=Conexibacter sp. SYSU D00693 TaxID=2812560 RepID=UPI00196B0D13|nr:YciI family protein [Conexibacter sp. SYSU D00693]